MATNVLVFAERRDGELKRPALPASSSFLKKGQTAWNEKHPSKLLDG